MAITHANQPVRTLVPIRMDRLPWAHFHWMVVLGLGVSWILDGLEIQLVSASGFKDSLGMSSADFGFTATIYLIGQVCGALFLAVSLTDGAERSSSSLPLTSIWSALELQVWLGRRGSFISGVLWQVWGSAVNILRSIRRSTNSFPPNIVVGSISP